MTTSSGTKGTRDDEITLLLYRVRGEYLEMPGLRLTVAQAARLWALDPITSCQLLDDLTRVGFLVKSRDGAYLRPSAA